MPSSSMTSPMITSRLGDAHKDGLAVIGARDADFAFEQNDGKIRFCSPSEASTVPARRFDDFAPSRQPSCASVSPAKSGAERTCWSSVGS